ncbi:cys/Met metabolism pyridoxal-phosphate-dependent enzyme [Rhodotorula toruloides]|uniref:Cys/Met metabolism pyridoxal-phosphate-dependent enzyme n=1 Tax=Rhodotorula toruloides TaxID=5286 RepID=A0A511K8L4_RHOTO|nr:cys/Met metabolism pyridoxal-phosphate-dependent enzyme [Rhodotorula toruloides]
MIPQPGTAAAQPVQPIEPVLTSNWRRVEAMPAREMLVDLGTDEGEGPDDWEDDEVEYLTLEFGNHLPADLLAEHNEVQLLAPESLTPFARVGHKYFQGTHQTLIGNDIFFLHEPDAEPSYRPFTTSSYRINFQPVNVEHDPDKPTKDATTRLKGKGRATEPAQTLDEHAQPVKRRFHRPKGSKNKPKPPPVEGTPAPARQRRPRTSAIQAVSLLTGQPVPEDATKAKGKGKKKVVIGLRDKEKGKAIEGGPEEESGHAAEGVAEVVTAEENSGEVGPSSANQAEEAPPEGGGGPQNPPDQAMDE